jgi:hypothetical protein
VVHALVAYRAEQQFGEAAAATAADDEEIGTLDVSSRALVALSLMAIFSIRRGDQPRWPRTAARSASSKAAAARSTAATSAW